MKTKHTCKPHVQTNMTYLGQPLSRAAQLCEGQHLFLAGQRINEQHVGPSISKGGGPCQCLVKALRLAGV